MWFAFMLLLTVVEADLKCDHTISLRRDEQKRVTSPNYPGADGPKTSCRWTVQATEGVGIVFSCPFPNRGNSTKTKLPCHGQFDIKPEGENKQLLCAGKTFTQVVHASTMVIRYDVQDRVSVDGFVCYVRLLDDNTERRVTTIHSGVNGAPELVCDLHQGSDVVTRVNWYREGKLTPIYTMDARGRSLDNATQWADEKVFGGRAFLKVIEGFAYLVVNKARLEDTDRYRCEVEFKNSATRNTEVILTVGDRKAPVPFAGCDETIHINPGQKAEMKSFGYPHRHPPNKRCRWTVDSPFGTRVRLSCPRLYRPKPEVDPCTFFKIYKTGVIDNSKTKFQCQSDTNSETSLDNAMIITFTNNPSDTLPFTCHLTAVCDQEIHFNEYHKGTKFQSPNYPLMMPPNEYCRWTVDSPADTVIALSCPQPSHPKETPCRGFFGIAPDGQTHGKFHSVKTICRDDGFVEYSVANKMIIEFKTVNDSNLHMPFVCNLTVEQINKETAIDSDVIALPKKPVPHMFQGCDETIHVKNGETAQLKSFKYPNLIPPGRHCRWTIYGPLGTEIEMSCPRLTQPEGDPCKFFSIYNTGNMDKPHTSFSCRDKVNVEVSEGNAMVLTLTGNFVVFNSFACNLTVSCGRTLNLRPGQKGIPLRSPIHPLKSCRWTVKSPPGNRILLSCPNDNLPKETPCRGMFTMSPDGDPSFRFNTISSYCRHKGFAQYSEHNVTILQYTTTEDTSISRPFVCYLSVERFHYEIGLDDEECFCGKRNTARIEGGKPTAVHEFNMLAGLVMRNNRFSHFCVATVISEYYAATAAGCLEKKAAKDIALVIGEPDYSQANETGGRLIINIEEIKMNLNFDSSKKAGYDIALVRVERSIFFNRNIGSACLPFRNKKQSFSGQKVYALGWGPSGVVEMAEMSIVDDAQCATWFPLYSEFKQHLLCIYSLGKDICWGASVGGPILWLDPVTFQLKLVGIQKSGACEIGKGAGLVTRVTNFLDWIEDNIWGDFFCKI